MYFNVVYTELLKLKRSIILWILPIATIVPIILSLVPLYHMKSTNEGDEFNLLVMFIQGDLAFLNLIIGVPLFTLITSYVFSIEYQQRTINNLFTYSYSRLHFLFGKMTVIFILITAVILSSFFISLIVAVGVLSIPIDYNIIIKYLIVYSCMILMQFALVPFYALLSIWKKNIIFPMFISIILTVIAGLIMEYDIAMLFPWSTPSRVTFGMTNYYNYASVRYDLSISSLTFLFFVSLILNIKYYNNSDVQ
ncbi:hypothetical protein CON65_03545 [Bacillus pseudomycoides]|uniref:ABC transporter permease n=1 Tax=Bacillus pseudomycoides TaxID=64104 RepID=A0AA91ZUJ0_9BACI|nr:MULTISPECIES: ABC transporter permease [Bacillus]PEB54353.1 hypothetical protein COO03_05735 [Bacillus sp. AFS098217]PED83966.1 hypothetical protein CON65_03545 [Bacillus pseudomycoides]PEU16632.1 hypothetical protein CN524_03885 [Bacillus sp. AFS019443]